MFAILTRGILYPAEPSRDIHDNSLFARVAFYCVTSSFSTEYIVIS